MSRNRPDESLKMPRRDFLYAASITGAGVILGPRYLSGTAWASSTTTRKKGPATIRAAFLYPPSELLERAGYYSWPGSGFDAEGHQKQYAGRITAIGKKLNVRILIDEKPLYEQDHVTQFINDVKQQKPDGLLLIPFKKSSWTQVERIIDDTGIPTVAMATLGILLMPHIRKSRSKPGVYTISSLDNFDAIEYGLKMIRTARWMKESRILSITGTETKETTVPHLGTKIRVVPMQRLVDAYQSTETTDQVTGLARDYLANAKERREPSEDEVLEAARAYVACKRMIADEQADAVMIRCLEGIREKQIPPPCMAYMSLRDEGIVAGCQNDLNATLTMMLVQQLFDKPGFQQNAACDTEKNLYFGAHCTCPSKLQGPSGPAEPYILRNHAEAGVGVVPQVLWPAGQEVTMAHYLRGVEPKMLVYSGKVVRCYDTPPAGGCRTNVVTTINEVDACDVKGMHQTIFHGSHTQQLKAYCQMFGITATA